jgi:hypothetical protein
MIKYIWSAAGYGLIAVPLLFTRTKRSLGIQADEHSSQEEGNPDNAVADRTESTSVSHLLISNKLIQIQFSLYFEPTPPVVPSRCRWSSNVRV